MTTPQQRRCLEALGIDLWVQRERSPRAERPAAAVVPVAPESTTGRAAREPTCASGPVAQMDWDTLRVTVAGCEMCPLHMSRTQTVFGVGDTQAKWMFIGEAPGAEEDRRGEPFVGPAGQLLNAMLAATGRRREHVYIANVLKCRPPGNRDPQPEEAARCAPYLHRQIELLSPQVIIAVGRIAAQRLLGTTAPLGRLRGRTHEFKTGARSIPLIVTYHPAYLLRSPREKAKAWADLRRVMELSP